MNTEHDVTGSDGRNWVKSSYSGDQGGACIEVAAGPGAVRVRDSKDATGPHLALTPGAWSAFVVRAAGEPLV